MKIFIHALHYNPTRKPISRLLNDLVTSLSRRGHEIVVFTARNGQRAEPFCNERLVKIFNLGALSESTILKLLDYISFYFLSALTSVLLGARRRQTVTIFRSGFGISSFAAYILSIKSGSNTIFWVLDRHPDILFENKLVQRKRLFNILKALEIGMQKRLPNLVFETQNDQDDYLAHGGLQNSTLVRTWYESFNVTPSRPAFWEQQNLGTKKVFLYSGNIGNSVDLSTMVSFFVDRPEYVLLVLGSGSKLKELKSLIESSGSKNIFLADYLDEDEYFYVLKNASYGVVSLKSGINIFSSKLTSYIACNLPILAFISDDNEMAGIIREFECGLVVNQKTGAKRVILTDQKMNEHRMNTANAKKLFEPSVNIEKLVKIVENPRVE